MLNAFVKFLSLLKATQVVLQPKPSLQSLRRTMIQVLRSRCFRRLRQTRLATE